MPWNEQLFGGWGMMLPWVPVAALVAVVTIGFATAPLAAHHGTNISYDRSKQWTAKAVVTEFKYVNPHVQLFFDVTDEKGKVTHWSGELLPNPAMLLRSGWTRKRSSEALQYGTKIVVTVRGEREFEWRGEVYKSLSAVANAITGSHVSGVAFFGLAKKGGKP